MENNLLYCYKDWLKKEEGTLFKKIFKIPVKIRVLLASLIIVFIAFLIFGFMEDENNNYVIVEGVLSIVYIVLCVTVSMCTERHQIKNSEDDLKSYKSYCIRLKTNVITKHKIPLDIIPKIIDRLNTMSDSIEEKTKYRHEQFNKFMEMLLIPISAVILGALLDKEISVTEVLGFGLSGTVIILGVYALIVLVLRIYDAIMRVPQGGYRRFATDLQSILDFEQCDSDTESNDPVTTSTLTDTSPENEVPQTQTIQ